MIFSSKMGSKKGVNLVKNVHPVTTKISSKSWGCVHYKKSTSVTTFGGQKRGQKLVKIWAKI